MVGSADTAFARRPHLFPPRRRRGGRGRRAAGLTAPECARKRMEQVTTPSFDGRSSNVRPPSGFPRNRISCLEACLSTKSYQWASIAIVDFGGRPLADTFHVDWKHSSVRRRSWTVKSTSISKSTAPSWNFLSWCFGATERRMRLPLSNAASRLDGGY